LSIFLSSSTISRDSFDASSFPFASPDLAARSRHFTIVYVVSNDTYQVSDRDVIGRSYADYQVSHAEGREAVQPCRNRESGRAEEKPSENSVPPPVRAPTRLTACSLIMPRKIFFEDLLCLSEFVL
jgi:hypothetical protein